MKAIKIKLLGMVLVLTAVTAPTISGTAQRRSSQSRTERPRVEREEKSRKNLIREKSTFKDYDKRRKSVEPSKRRIQKNPRNEAPNRTYRSSRSPSQEKRPSRITRNRSENQQNPSRVKSAEPQRPSRASRYTKNADSRRRTPETYDVNRNRSPKTQINERKTNRSSTIGPRPSGERRSVREPGTYSNRENHSRNRQIYRLEKNDKRYKTAKNYKGSNIHWSRRAAPGREHYSRHNKKYYSHFNYRKYKHWDRRWQRYRWNLNSWREYYASYHPYSFRFHKHYVYHPEFGHIIRKFSYRPVFFIHNHQRYYSYNGHFFRYFRGIGYILVDMPYGIVFEHLPVEYERVYINGYLYFRTGNLFFEMTPDGFRLVHYPERYFAYDDDFYHGGIYYD